MYNSEGFLTTLYAEYDKTATTRFHLSAIVLVWNCFLLQRAVLCKLVVPTTTNGG